MPNDNTYVSPAPMQLAVCARNAGGACELVLVEVHATAAQCHDGDHYDLALVAAQERGFDPIVAFGPGDPAWDTMQEHRVFKAFFDSATEALQDALVEGRECSGADIISEVGQLFTADEIGEQYVYVAASADGYWCNADGWGGEAQDAGLFRDPEFLRHLVASSEVVPIGLRIDQLDRLQDFPSIDDLQDAMTRLQLRAREYGFTIEPMRGHELLTEELQLTGAEAPPVATWEFLRAFVANALAKAAEEDDSPAVAPAARG